MTRMWMVDPRLMCDQHLLGEHKELHQLVGAIHNGTSIEGHIKKGQVEPRSLQLRHDELVEEMENRGFDHGSPLPEIDDLPSGTVDRFRSLIELCRRCDDCSHRVKSKTQVVER